MSNENKNIDDLFRERLGDYTETPPASSWSTLQGSLGQAKPPFVQITGGLLNYTITTLLVVSVAVLGVKYYMSHSRNEVVSTKSSQSTNEMPVAQGTSAEQGAGGEKQAPNATTEKSEGQSGIVTSDASAPVEGRSTSVSGSGATVSARGNNSDQAAQKGKTKQYHVIASNAERKTTTSRKQSGGNNPRVYQSSTGQPAKSAGIISAPSVENKISENNLPAPSNSLSSTSTGANELAAGLTPDEKSTIAAEEPKPVAAAKKDNKPAATTEENPIADKKSLPTPDKWELWAKGGYEQNKNGQVYGSIIAPYLQRNFGKRFSLAAQPGLKTSNVTQKYLQGSQSFYHVNSDGAITEYDSTYGIGVGGGGIDSSTMFIFRNYRYTQTHDSVVKTYTAGGTMISLDLPITAKFKLSKHLALTAGILIHAGSYLGINERTTTYNNIMQTGYDSTVGITGRAIPSPKPLNEIISYNGNQLSTYKGPLFTTPAGIVVTYGYTLGFSYEIKERFMLDATAQKSTVSSQMVGGYNINSYLSDWYFRLMLGYRIL